MPRALPRHRRPRKRGREGYYPVGEKPEDPLVVELRRIADALSSLSTLVHGVVGGATLTVVIIAVLMMTGNWPGS